MVKSIGAVLVGILISLAIGALEIFGIAAPVFTRFFSAGLVSTTLPAIVVVFAAAFAFYFGGMAAAYRAPNRRRLHGVMVGVASFAISPIINITVSSRGVDPFANLRTPGGLLLTAVLVAAVLGASYVGARRGEMLHAHNQATIRSQRSRKARERLSDQDS